MVSALIGFAVVAGFLTMVPGIDTALVMRAAIVNGRGAAYATVVGISLGILAWAVAAAVGVSALLEASQFAYDVLRLLGAAYMLFLGVRLIWRTRRHDEPPPVATSSTEPARLDWGVSFRRGLLTNLLNPKIGAFYVAVLPQFLPPDSNTVLAGLALSLVHVIESVIWFSVLILSTQLLRSWLQTPRVRTWTDRITGGVLVGFGLKVAWR